MINESFKTMFLLLTTYCSLTVTVNDEYEEVSYSSRSFWSVGGKEDDDNVIYTYDINIGGSTNDEKLFTGTISDVIIDGR